MISVTTAQLSALKGRAVGEAWLVSLDFAGGMQRVTTWAQDIVSGGQTWTALGSTLGISQIKGSEDAGPDQVTLSLPLQVGMLSLVLGNVESYRGRRARIYYQIMDAETLQPIGDPLQMYVGEMQPVKVDRDGAGAGGGPVTGRIEMQLTRAGMSSARRADGLRVTHAQQQALYPGDMGLQYLGDLVASDAKWLSAAFQRAWSQPL